MPETTLALIALGLACACACAGAGAAAAVLLGRRERGAKGRASEGLSSDALASVSHEIRTPLNGILGLTQLLLETGPSPKQREYLEMIKSSGGTLLRAMNDILDYSSIQAGKLSIESEAFHCRRWVRQCIKTLAPQAHIKGIELAYRVAPDVPTLVAGDPTRLRQVLVNLAVNAIKYTNDGHVVVDVGYRADEDGTRGRGTLLVSVSDTGVGIEREMQSSIFRAFTQAEPRPGEPASGLGLGLAISSEIVERMDGRIAVASEPGRGSVFRFEVPILAVEGSDDESDARGALGGVSALVVDDSPVQRDVLGKLLEHWGVEVTLASDDVSAIEAARATTFTLMLIDSRMPWTDSFELAERIQKLQPVKGVLMTLAHEQVSAESLQARGFVGQLTKPIAPVHLMRAIEIIRRGASVEKSSDVQSYTMDRLVLGGLRLLVAEDNPVNQTVLLHSLQRNGCEVEIADNGRDALRLATERSYDALLLDLEMPELDGLSVCREIRRGEATSGQHLAIVAATAHARAEDRDRCIAAGMDAFVSKPFDEAQLVAALDGALRSKSRTRSQSRSKPESSSASSSTSNGGGDVRGEVFDRARALAHANDDEALLDELIGLFLDEHPRTIERLGEEIARGSVGPAERLSHRLKGALLTLGAASAAASADALEDCLKAGDAATSREAMRRLSQELSALVPVLRANLVSGDGASVPAKPGPVPGSQSSLPDRRSR